MSLKIYEDSKNYTGTVVKVTTTFSLPGLDNVVGTSVFGNTCIIPKKYPLGDLYIFFPSETQLSEAYLKGNNLYRNSNLNEDQKSKGYFEDNGRVKAIKFKGNKSTGVVMPIGSLANVIPGASGGVNKIIFICKKYIVPVKSSGPGTMKSNKVLDEIIDSRMFPEHIDTSQLLKNLDKINLLDEMSITIKLHGTSARIGHTLTKRKLKWHEKLAKKLGVKVVDEEYSYVIGSRHVVKSVNFNELKNKNHFYEDDLWTMVGKVNFQNKLHKGEIVYFEIIGKDKYQIRCTGNTYIPLAAGVDIQKGYSYGLNIPKVYVYRITHINSQGVEVDLSWRQVRKRCTEIGVDPVITDYEGKVSNFAVHQVGCAIEDFLGDPEPWKDKFEKYFIKTYLDRPSWLDSNVIEEGIVIRIEDYPNPRVYKLKSPLFLIHESKQADAEVIDVETQN